jgi:hypothetical protein
MIYIDDFDIATDLKVYLWSWDDPDAFIIGWSLLGGPDVLSSSELVATEIECQVANAEVSKGFDLLTSTSFQMTAAEMSLSIRVANSDPFTNHNFIAGRKISLEVGETPESTYPVFVGYISGYDFEYIPGEQVIMNLTAHDGTYYLNSTEIDTVGVSGEYSLRDHFVTIFSATGFYDRTASPGVIQYELGGVEFIDTSTTYDLFKGNAGDLMNNRIQAEQGVYDYVTAGANQTFDDTIFIYTRQSILDNLAGDPYYTLSANEVCDDESAVQLSTLRAITDLSLIDNDVYVELAHNPTTNLKLKDLGSQVAYGTNSIQGSFPFRNSTYLDTWATYALNTNVRPRIETVSLPAITRSGDLEGIALVEPIQTARVVSDFNGANIDKKYMIIRARHTITPDNWTIDLNLWSKD